MKFGIYAKLKVTSHVTVDSNEDVVTDAYIHSVLDLDLIKPD